MDHIIADFDLSTHDVPTVPDLTRTTTEEDTEESTAIPDSWEKFQSYPRENGWWLDEETFVLKLLPGIDAKTVDLIKFLQSWLFFGLVMTIVQRNGKPLLRYEKLVEVNSNGRHATTKHLPTALEKWMAWEQESLDLGMIAQVRLRMVRVDAVLNAARRTIRANCGHRSNIVTQPSPLYDEEEAVRDKVALSLMILGETLSSFKAQIMKRTQSGLKGWHHQDENGWGTSSYILKRMDMDGWCLRTIHLWRSQFRANATLMLASYLAYDPLDRFKGPHHDGCTEQDCKVISRDGEGNYRPAHSHLCDSSCSMSGPDITVIRGCLNKGRIPLLQFQYPPVFNGIEGPLDLTVITIPENERKQFKYATISHVWSDGFGNENKNELHHCQLLYIRRNLDKIDPGNGWNTPFWMDTLIIPVGRVAEDKALRKCAIRQIIPVFRESAYTIVLDAGLSQMYPGNPDKPAVAAMRILGSSWMRRLWTLQEAFLSRKMYFPFEDNGTLSNLKDFDDLCKKLGSDNDIQGTTVLLHMVNHHLRHLTMTHDHEILKRHPLTGMEASESKMPQGRTALLVASYWKAARWRKTSTASHETLALATLLDLDYENSSIVGAGGKQREDPQPRASVTENDRLVQEFWTQFNKRWPKSIPPGMIFLPGERVDRVGFGWALRTWMTSIPVDYPDPLALLTSTGELDMSIETGLNGLKVKYPGFLLHPQERRHILTTDKQTRRRFWFPTSPSFLDWYMVEPIDDDIQQSFIHGICESQDRLGIIVSRAKPGDFLADIGLLVQVREGKTAEMRTSRFSCGASEERTPSSRSRSPTDAYEIEAEAEHLYCEIVRRVKVSRETRSEFRTKNRAGYLLADDYNPISSRSRSVPQDIPARNHMIPEVMIDSADVHGIICLAEELGSEQVWYVDGFFPNRHDSLAHNAAAEDVSPPDALHSRLLKMFI